ncbi:MAG: hypothetical protein ABJB93_11755 [Gaiellales bacterium]
MARIRDLPGAAWFAIGLGAAALIVPAAAVAAGNVGIIGSNGNTAKVTASGSLQVAEATPAAFKEYVHFGLASGVCTKVATVPANKGFVLKEATADVWDDPSPGSGQVVQLFTKKTCSDSSIIFDVNPASVGAYQYAFEPGFGVAPGHSLYAAAFGSVGAETYLNGFYVNPKAIHVNTPHAVTGKAVAQK